MHVSKLILIDGNAIIHRTFHALPPLTTKKGEPIGAVHGFVAMLLKVIQDLKPSHLAVAFDEAEPTFRHEAFEDYQANRPALHDDLISQFSKVRDSLKAFGIPVYTRVGFEADDVIGTIAKRSRVDEVIIVTGDKDILQLVDKKIKVYLPIQGLSEAQLVDEKGVVEKMGVRADQMIDYKALVGDPSDNYKGVPGIGPKTAESLLKEYGSFNNIYRNLKKIKESVRKKLELGRESGEQSLKLAKIITDVEIDFDLKKASQWKVKNPQVIRLFQKFGFKTLTKRVGGEKEDFEKVVVFLAQKLKGQQYAFRGTASLVLQGLEMNLEDIDIVCDKKTALACNQLLKEYLLEKVEFQQSPEFKSYFGKFILQGWDVEVMGQWQIKTKKGWSQIFDASQDEIVEIEVQGKKVKVTKIETELAMFASMGRWNAYHKIKKQLEKKNQLTLV